MLNRLDELGQTVDPTLVSMRMAVLRPGEDPTGSARSAASYELHQYINENQIPLNDVLLAGGIAMKLIREADDG